MTDDDKYVTIEYINNGTSLILTAEEILQNNSQEFNYVPIPDKKFFVSIDRQKACKWVDDNAERICEEYLNTSFINELPDKYVINYNYYLDGGSFNPKYSSIESAKLLAGLHRKQLFFFKDSFYMADLQEFMKYRINNLKYHYKKEISKIGTLPLINKRSSHTLRLHNYLVNFPSKILQFININNQNTFQLDLRTSQFLLFANLLNVYIKSGEDMLLYLFKKPQTKTHLKRFIKVLKEHKDLLPSIGVDINKNKPTQSSYDIIKFITDVFYNDFYTIVQKHLDFLKEDLQNYYYSSCYSKEAIKQMYL